MKRAVLTAASLAIAALIAFDVTAPAQNAADDAYEQGKRAFESQDYAKAIDSLTTSIKAAPNFAKALELRGEAYSGMRQFDKAIADLNAALKIDPKMDIALYARGTAEYASGKYQQAVDDLTKYLTKRPTDDLALTTRGNAYEKLGKNDLAQADLGKVEYSKQVRFAKDRFTQKKYDECLPFADKAISLDPARPEAYGIRGECYGKQKRWDLALADFQKQVEKTDKKDPGPIYFVGLAYSNLKQFDNAVAEAQKYLAVKPDDAQAWFLLGDSYMQGKKYPEAVKALDKAVALVPSQYIYIHTRGRSHRLAGDYDKAIADVDAAYKMAPNEQWMLIERALAYEKQGKTDLANKDRQIMKDAGFSDWNSKE